MINRSEIPDRLFDRDRRPFRFPSRFVFALALLVAPSIGMATEPSGEDFFESRVRPVLVEHCTDCHGEDSAESDLRVDTLAGLLRGGERGPAIVIGKPNESLLIGAIRHGELLKMPEKTKLPAKQIADLARWVEIGAPWPNAEPLPEVTSTTVDEEPDWSDEQKSFWAFRPPVRSPVPSTKRTDWVRTPIDAFILARLEAAELAPARKAQKRTLLRRAALDLIGIPPTPEEIDAFLADETPDAFAHVIDRLLASPFYGQRWGRHWLDVARYADSNGLDENLAFANAFRYRDYVVRAFNRDLPFDQFVREQLAGDLLSDRPDASDAFDRLTATGFLSLGAKMLAEDDPVKMRMDIIDEQIDTIGRTFMGITLGCARCHDHKFDPVSTHDYYGLAGIFESTRTMENFSVVARWQELPLAEPDALEARAAHLKQIAGKQTEIDRLVQSANAAILDEARLHAGDYLLAALRRRRLDELHARARPHGARPDIESHPGTVLVEAEDFARGNVEKDFRTYGKSIGVLVNKGATPNFAEYDIDLPEAGMYRVELRYAAAASRPCKLFVNGALVKPDAAGAVTGSWNPDGQKWEVQGFFEFETGRNVVRLEQPQFFPHIDKLLLAPEPDGIPSTDQKPFDPTYQPLPELVGQWTTWLGKIEKDADPTFAELRDFLSTTRADVRDEEKAPASIPEAAASKANRDASIRELANRYGERFRKAEEKWRRLMEKPNAKNIERLDDDAEEALRQVLYRPDGPFAPPANIETRYGAEKRGRLVELRGEKGSLEKATPQFAHAMAVSDQTPKDVRIHVRGSHLSQGAVVPRRMLRVLAPESQSTIDPGASGRLELADWLANPSHPLTARVIVNRIWLWHFGQGLVRSPDNFGRLGERPTHPELLDWLTVRFVESGWSIKALHRLILRSSTWQQSAEFGERAAEVDPENRLWWRMNRRRLEAEAIRDSMLAVCGTLDGSMGGSLLPTKNRAYVTSTANIDPVVYVSNRRSIYLPVVRSALFDVFQAFDFADPSVLNGQRQSTTVAPQALFMMNSRFSADVALRLAQRIAREEPADPNARVVRAWRLVYGRSPSADEIARSVTYVGEYETRFGRHYPDRDDAPLRAWQSLCRALLGANEFLFVE